MLLISLLLLPLSTSAAAKSLSNQQNESAAAESAVDHLDTIRERGELVMLTFPHQLSSFVRTNLEKGTMPKRGSSDHFLGIDVEIMEGFARYLGVELLVQRVSEPTYSALIPDLLAGKGDVIASSLSITEERQQEVDFSDPYFLNYPVVVTGVDSTIETMADLQDSTAAVIPGSSQEEHLRRLGVTSEWFVTVSFRAECYYAVEEGQADYTLADANSALRVLATMPVLQIAFRLPEDEYYGFAVPPGSTLLAPLNRYLEDLKRSGRLAEIIERNEASARSASR